MDLLTGMYSKMIRSLFILLACAFLFSGKAWAGYFDFLNQSANKCQCGPTSGGPGEATYRSIVPADIPTLNQSTTGNAATATALATTPTQCTGGQFATGVAASGNANCSTPATGGSLNGATSHFTQSGGITYGLDIDGVRQVKASSTITAIYINVGNVTVAGTITIKLNYGTTLGSSVTASFTTTGTGAQGTSVSESIAVSAGYLLSVDVVSATGNAEDLTVELVY